MSNGSEEVCLHTLLDNLCPLSLSLILLSANLNGLSLSFSLLCIASLLMECINHAYITQKVQKKDDWSLDFGGGRWMLRLRLMMTTTTGQTSSFKCAQNVSKTDRFVLFQQQQQQNLQSGSSGFTVLSKAWSQKSANKRILAEDSVAAAASILRFSLPLLLNW